MENISTILKETVQKLPNASYMRATDDDANIEIENIDIKGKTVFIYRNLPTVTNSIQKGGHIQSNYPTEIDVLQLADFDDNTLDGDEIRASCKDMADKLMDHLKIRTDSVTPIPAYQVVFSESVQVKDTLLTGCVLRFNWIFDRTSYDCG